jgi:hypothetical protein
VGRQRPFSAPCFATSVPKRARLAIDYVVHHRRQWDVEREDFQARQPTLAAGEELEIDRAAFFSDRSQPAAITRAPIRSRCR